MPFLGVSLSLWWQMRLTDFTRAPPGNDGMQARMCAILDNFFIPIMTEFSQQAFTTGRLPWEWELGLINYIPKASRLAAVSKPRHIALQDVKKKWVMNIASLQIEQTFQQLTRK